MDFFWFLQKLGQPAPVSPTIKRRRVYEHQWTDVCIEFGLVCSVSEENV